MARKTTAPKPKLLKLVKNDPWLLPFNDAIEGRHNHALAKIDELTRGTGSLSGFADGHLYFGLHREGTKWVFREWARHRQLGAQTTRLRTQTRRPV